MRWKIEFQYKPSGQGRPYDYVQEERLEFNISEHCPLPNVGDTVDLMEDDRIVTRKVLTRHFSYSYPENIFVNIVLTDIEPGEMAARIKA